MCVCVFVQNSGVSCQGVGVGVLSGGVGGVKLRVYLFHSGVAIEAWVRNGYHPCGVQIALEGLKLCTRFSVRTHLNSFCDHHLLIPTGSGMRN